MTNSRYLAKLIGPTTIAMILSEVINPHIWAAVSATQVYLAGGLWFIAGLSIIRAHNYWGRDWPVLITLLGYFLMIGGLFRMFFPEFNNQIVQNSSLAVAVLQIILFLIGLFLTYKAYSGAREDDI